MRISVVVVLIVVLVAAFVVLNNTLLGEDTTSAASSSASTSDAGTLPGCDPAPPPPGTQAQLDVPSTKGAKGKTFTATLTTNCGDITVELYGDKAPQTVASFRQLARTDYWRNSPCHRLTTSGIHVLQCGDPTGTGQGNPGYGYGIENAPDDGTYPRGTLAMARTNDPDSNGGQFFVVYEDSQLPTEGGGYSIFGKVTGGMDIVDRIAAAGVAGGGTDGAPEAPISILRVAVTEKKA
jgi:peptidyl-prolyl cis-trans isomerase B (cyclophilin B)